MEALWYQKEKELDEMAAREAELKRSEVKQVTRRVEDFKANSITGPWMFVSNIKGLTIVKKASSRVYDPDTQISQYKQGEVIKFEMGRFITVDPKVVDFLLSKKEFGSMYVAGFNVGEYKDARRSVLGLTKSKEIMAEDISEPLPVAEDFFEEEVLEEEPLIYIPKEKELQKALKSFVPEKSLQDVRNNERLDKLEANINKMYSLIEALAARVCNNETIGKLGAQEPEEIFENKGYSCKRCGMSGFGSGHEVAQHRKNGECNREIARKITLEGMPRVTTGMSTAR